MLLEMQCRKKESQLSSKESSLSSVTEKLEQVRAAQEKIKFIKAMVLKKNKKLNNLDYTQCHYWDGENREKFEHKLHTNSCVSAKEFYNRVDDLYDDLINTERRLIDEKNNLCIVIEQLHDGINWICPEIKKANN